MTTGLQNIIRALLVVVWLVFPLSAGAAEKVLVIDSAHGGTDTGVKLSRSVHEKDVTLAIAMQVRESLSGTDGITVHLTRSNDSDVSAVKRKKMLGQPEVDLAISLHVNAGFGQKAEGYEVYYCGHAAPSVRGNNAGEIVSDMEQTRRFNSSVLFAQIVQKNMEKVFPRKGRGLREAPVHLLRSLTVPAILLEVGFSTELKERKQLRDLEVQKAIAAALAQSVKEYFSAGGAS